MADGVLDKLGVHSNRYLDEIVAFSLQETAEESRNKKLILDPEILATETLKRAREELNLEIERLEKEKATLNAQEEALEGTLSFNIVKDPKSSANQRNEARKEENRTAQQENSEDLIIVKETIKKLGVYESTYNKLSSDDDHDYTDEEKAVASRVIKNLQAQTHSIHKKALIEESRINKPVPVPPSGPNGEDPENMSPPRAKKPAAEENLSKTGATQEGVILKGFAVEEATGMPIGSSDNVPGKFKIDFQKAFEDFLQHGTPDAPEPPPPQLPLPTARGAIAEQPTKGARR